MEVAVKKRIPKEYLGAFKEGHRKTARGFVDQDYVHSLLSRAEKGDKEAAEALAWITKFNNEYYRGVFLKNGEDFHDDEQKRKEIQNEMYSRKNDLSNGAHPIDSREVITKPSEDLLILLIDLKKEQQKAKKQ